MSSKEFPDTYEVDGVFSPVRDESPMWNANKAYLFYCSSDLYMGRKDDPILNESGFSWKFRG